MLITKNIKPKSKIYLPLKHFYDDYTEVEDIKVLSLADFANFGKPAKIVKLFGGKAQLCRGIGGKSGKTTGCAGQPDQSDRRGGPAAVCFYFPDGC